MDPWAGAWERASAVEAPLYAQTQTIPKGGRRGSVTARAMHDDRRLYVLLEWNDRTKEESVGRSEGFADQAAVQFPAPAGERIPAFCMGDPQASVNIWIWKASRQADVDLGYRDLQQVYPRAVSDWYPFEDKDIFYPPLASGNVVASRAATPVENLVAGQFGTLTTAPEQTVHGVGRWRDGRWRVLFARGLPAPGEGDAGFRVPGSTDIAFAIWDGARGDRNGQKSVSQFLSLDVSPERFAAPSRLPLSANQALLIGLGLTALLALAYFAFGRLVGRERGEAS